MGLFAGADPRMVRIGTGPPFWQINHANSAYFRLFLGYFGVISANRPPLFTYPGSSPVFVLIISLCVEVFAGGLQLGSSPHEAYFCTLWDWTRKHFISSISNTTYLLFYFRICKQNILYWQLNFKIASKTTFTSCYLVEIFNFQKQKQFLVNHFFLFFLILCTFDEVYEVFVHLLY